VSANQGVIPLLAVVALLALPGAARADDVAVSVRWSAPAGCPAEEVVRGRVLALAGTGIALDAQADVTEESGEFRAKLRVQVGDSVGERVLHAPSCETLAESVAVVLAMSGTTAPPAPMPRMPTPPPPPPAPRPTPPSPAAPGATPTPPASTPTPEPAPFRPALDGSHVRLATLGSVDVGTLPSPAFGGTFSAAYAAGLGFAFGLSASVWLSQTPSGAPTADFSLATFDATACKSVLRRGPIELSPCAVVELARMSATGLNATGIDETATAVWIAVGLRAQGRWELTRRLALVLSVEAIVPTVGEGFRVTASTTGSDVVHNVGGINGRAHFGPEVRF